MIESTQHNRSRASRRRRRPAGRGGYAMASVMIFLGVMLAFIGISQRRISSALRLERARLQAEFRDESAMQALADGIRLLETGFPPTNPYVCRATVSTSRGPQSFDLTFTAIGPDQWTVVVGAPSAFAPRMPSSFAD